MIQNKKYRKYWQLSLVALSTFIMSSLHLYAGNPKDWNEDSVFVNPEAGRTPTIKAFEAAEKSIQFAGYKLSDEKIIEVLKKKAAAGVRIEMLVEHEIFKHDTSSNVDSPLEELKKLPNFFVYTRPDYVKQVHQKFAIIDGQWGFMTTGNYDAESFDGDKAISAEPCRDFLIPIFDKKIFQEMKDVFEADCRNKEQPNLKTSDLIWGPDNHETKFIQLIAEAAKEGGTLDIYQQDCSDERIRIAIVEAIKKGAKVRLINTPYPFSKKQDNNIPTQQVIREAGGFVGLSNKHYMHAKVVIVNGTEVAVFSTNFYRGSLDGNREFGLIITNLKQIKIIQDRFNGDWEASDHN